MADHRRFFIDPGQISGDEALIEGGTARQICKVLRLTVGDAITLLDGVGGMYSATITSLSGEAVRARITREARDINEPRLRLTLASCVPKSDRTELIVQKCTELGICEMILVQSERTISRLDETNSDRKLERWRRIAAEAAEQCGRSKAPVISGPVRFADLVKSVSQYQVAIIAWEEELGLSLKDALRAAGEVESALVIIGPEGGLSSGEVEAAKAAGAVCVSLGGRVLRTDTAAIATCAAVMYDLEGEL